jgi:tRNA pseudouridine55 synthase
MFGFLNLDKPAGCTSREVVDSIQRLVRPIKVGHAGTLDPLATGVLVVALGNATRLVQFIHVLPKSYRATFQLGCQSASDDIETEVLAVPIPDTVTVAEIERQLSDMKGPIRQVPPRYSAVKIKGRRAYQLARKGVDVALAEKMVVIHDARLLSWQCPCLQIELQCSTGTYVRAIGRDLAMKLGTSAVMTELVRTAVGPFLQSDAHVPEDVTKDTLPAYLCPPLFALGHLVKRQLEDSEVTDVRHGRAVPVAVETPGTAPGRFLPEMVAAVDSRDQLVAVLQLRQDDRYWPVCVFPSVPLV